MALAPQIANPGNNGSNARYNVAGLTFDQGRGAYTDGTYFYDSNGLSLDRPDRFVSGLPAANANYEDYWRSRGGFPGGASPPGQPGAPGAMPWLPPFRRSPVLPPFMEPRTAPPEPWKPPSATDWPRQPGFYESDARDPAEIVYASSRPAVSKVPADSSLAAALRQALEGVRRTRRGPGSRAA